MPGSPERPLTPKQCAARDRLRGLISARNVGGRTLVCLVGPQGSGKTELAKRLSQDPAFGDVRYLSFNRLLLDVVAQDERYREIFGFSAAAFEEQVKRFGNDLRRRAHGLVKSQLLETGMTILDHVELVFTLGLDPVSLWYAEAQGQRRILLVLTGRMSGQQCLVGQNRLVRGDQPIVELEK